MPEVGKRFWLDFCYGPFSFAHIAEWGHIESLVRANFRVRPANQVIS